MLVDRWTNFLPLRMLQKSRNIYVVIKKKNELSQLQFYLNNYIYFTLWGVQK